MVATTVFGMGLFFAELRAAFGWSAFATSGGFSLQRLQGGVLQPLSGFVVDRVGTRIMSFLGVLLVGVGFVLFSQVTRLWEYYAALFVISGGISVGVGTALNASVVNWFRRNRSKALSIVWNGTPAAGALVIGLGLFIDSYGWEAAALMVGLVILAVGLPLSLLIRHRPEPYGLHPDGDLPGAATGVSFVQSGESGLTVAEALRGKEFWILSLGMAVELLAIQAIVIHQVAHLEESGWTRIEGAFVASAMAICFLLGRAPYGFIGDRFDKRWAFFVVHILVGFAIVVLEYATNFWMVVLYVGVMGVGHGAFVPLRLASVADWMGTARFASIMGLVEFPAIMTGVIGPLFLGAIFDWKDEYRIGLFVFAALLFLTAPVFLLLPKPKFTGRP